MFGRNKNKQNEHQDDSCQDRQQPARREPLQWQEETRIQYGFSIGTINSAERPDGIKIYSWCLGKEGRRDDRVMKFLDPRDIADAHTVLDDILNWVEDDRSGEHKS